MSKRNGLTPEYIRGQMLQGPFTPSEALPPPADPLVEVPMVLEIERIRGYDRNPRRERNPDYDSIKSSIRARGLDHPLTVTRRPGEEHYMLAAGGNTRLSILRELYAKTGEARFRAVICKFRPYRGETDLLAAHLIENDHRADLMFIDKAAAVCVMRALLQEELQRELSLRELAAELAARGYHKVAKTTLSRMFYAVEVLEPVMPEALRAGIFGPDQVDRLRRLEAVYSKYWSAHGAGDASSFREVFCEVLAANDRAEFAIEVAQEALEERLARETGVPLRELRLEVDALAQAHTSSGEDASVEPLVQHDRTTEREGNAATPISLNENQDRHETLLLSGMSQVSRDHINQMEQPPPRETHPQNAPESLYAAQSLLPSDATARIEITGTPPAASPPPSAAALRAQNLELACGIAGRHELELCVRPWHQWMGFIIDLPPRPMVCASDHPDRLLWWALLSASEQMVLPERLAELPENHRLGRLALAGKHDQIVAHVGAYLLITDFYFYLIGNQDVGARDFRALITLAENSRRLRQLGEDADAPGRNTP